MTFCRNYGQKHVTSFARFAHIPYVSYETGPQADVDQAASVWPSALQAGCRRFASRGLAPWIRLWRQKRAGGASFALPHYSCT